MKVRGGERRKTHRDVDVQLQQGSSDVGRQGHIVTDSSLLETGAQEEQSENKQHSVTLTRIYFMLSFSVSVPKLERFTAWILQTCTVSLLSELCCI